MEKGGYLYPWPSARCPQIAPFQFMYSSFTDGFRVKLQDERCTNPTFSRIHVLHARLIPSKVQQPSSGLYLVVGTLRASRSLAGPSFEGRFSLKTFGRHLHYRKLSSPSLRRFCSPGLCFRASSCILRSPEGGFPDLWRSRERPSPFGCARLPSLEPCKQVREHFREWDRPPGVCLKVQSPTVAPRG